MLGLGINCDRAVSARFENRFETDSKMPSKLKPLSRNSDSKRKLTSAVISPIAAEVLRDEFINAQSVDDVQPEVDEAGEATFFFACFIGFAADRMRATPEDTPKHATRDQPPDSSQSRLPFRSHSPL